METNENKGFVYEFGKFVLDPGEKTLYSDGVPLRLPAKEFETLLLLVENSGRALSKEEMLHRVWRDAFVEEGNLAKQISQLRKLLNTKDQKYIETLPKHGYRFTSDVNQITRSVGDTILEKRTVKRLTVTVDNELGRTQPPALPAPKRRISRLTPYLIFGLVMAAAFSGAWYWNERNDSVKIDSIAVLPMRPLTEDENSRVLGLGLADALITKLGSLRTIKVRPTSAVMKFSETNVDALEFGRHLKVDAVLEGTIQQMDGRLRINARLLRTINGEQLWAETFDAKVTNIFELEDRISEQTARALMFKLTTDNDQRLTKHYTKNAEAYDAYLKGRYFWNKRTEEGFKQAIEYFDLAVAKDPKYALAYSGLADCYILLGIWGALPPNEAMPKAKEAAMKSLQIDDDLAQGHVSMAFVKWVYDWDWAKADREFQRAIELQPNYATAHHWYSYYLAGMGRFEEAVAQIKKAQELEGELSFSIMTDIGEIYCWAKQYDKAAAQLQEVIQIDPGFAMARNTLGIVYLKKGQLNEAIAELEAARNLDNSPRMMSSLGYAYGVAGRREKARKMIDELREMSKHRYVSAFAIALVYEGLGEDEEAFEWLEKAYHERSDTMAVLNVYPLLENLRKKQRYLRIQQLVGFVPH